MIEKYFTLPQIRNNIIKKNIFRYRYKNNNDLFIHIRLGDIEHTQSSKYEYYDRVISNIKFNKGFISSDSIESETCKKLIIKYKLTVFSFDEVKTIMFGSTCNNIVLSGGTFSWLIGFLAFNSSNIYYPINQSKAWYGNIFIFPKWIGIHDNI
jgi:hypothetical protein